ncbi:uncharacterized protein [Typha latifolia]|uniref:uncharacterized protein n=1 Tax=Typha latifolia TaxID=4733 RepID=UPI003C2E1248
MKGHDRASEGGDDLKKKKKKKMMMMKAFRPTKASNLDVLSKSSNGCQSIQLNESPNCSKISAVGQSDCMPNYMKPTRSSNPTLTFFDSEAKNASTSAMRCIKNPKRPTMEKTLRMPPLPKKNIDTATFSWTLKDSKINKTLDLHPGGSESEKTSVLKVCRSPYCSLNGHKPPPLKDLPLLRQRSLRNGLSVETNTSKLATRKEQSTQEAINGKLSKFLKAASSMDYDEARCEEEASNLLPETYSDISYRFDLDQGTDISAEDIDGFMNFLKSSEYDLRLQAEEDYGEWASDGEDFAYSNANVLIYEATGMNCEEETWSCPSNKNDRDVNHAYDEFSFYSEMIPEDEIVEKNILVSSEGNQFVYKGSNLEYEEVHEPYLLDSCTNATVNSEKITDAEPLYNPEITFQDSIDQECNGLSSEGIRLGGGDCEFEAEETDYLIENAEESSSDCGLEDEIAKKRNIVAPESCNLECRGCNFRHEDEAEIHESNMHSGAKDEAYLTPDGCNVNKTVQSTAIEEENGNNKVEDTQTPQSLPVCEPKLIDLRQTAKKERKNATEWMTDYALQKVVTKLAPAPKRKVALLVKAFESVIPLVVMSGTPIKTRQ